ncbi:DUF5011 domain-containing protein [Hyalangium gracile]|uniref:DUF5011 domain-containing protein n=1 Tax=Hyalangium gracile TaxID=394092 RepID=UPI001CCC274A|nr:DUF5011 domain-containing protein [Hyalangium gracile]
MRWGLHSNRGTSRFTWALTGLNLLLATACGGELPPEEEMPLTSQASSLDSCTSPDVTPPTVLCQPEGGLMNCSGYGYFTQPSELLYFSDNCGTIWSSWSLGTLYSGTTSTGLTLWDAAGNQGSCSTTWRVIDIYPPSLTLNGDAQVVLPYGTRYIDPGAYASDSCDGQRNFQRSGDYNTYQPGIYPLTYTVADGAGHITQRTRLLTVLPQTDCTAQLSAPVLALQGRDEETLECGRNSWSEPGALAADACGAVTVHTYNSGQDPYGPGPNWRAEGRYTVQYMAWNGQGTTSAERTVIVKDTLPPTLRLKGDMRMTHTCGSNWVDPGVTATDDCYGDVSYSVQTAGFVNGWAEGTYTVHYWTMDPGGRKSNLQKRVVEVIDCPW